jgi:hypothetical protein
MPAPPITSVPKAADIVRRLAVVQQTVPSVRAVRRELSRELKAVDGPAVIALGVELTPLVPRFVTCELVADHPGAFAALNRKTIEQLGAGLASWYDTDAFGISLAGPAWRAGLLPDAAPTDWAHSSDLWWRRSALVATVPLNVAATRTGDAARTLAICRLLLDDREDMVVKAMSWALRALGVRNPAAAERFMVEHEDRLAPRAKRELRHKLKTGVKTPGRLKA